MTYIRAQVRWHYLATVLEFYARQVVGWALSNTSVPDLVIKALDMAYEQRGSSQGLLFHSDQKLKYGNRQFRKRLWCYRMNRSLSRLGNC
ncbi:hypothetical protein C1889_00520 [Pseudomonas sp. FW507-12TSA]|nr:hypothetical protein C1889_00520 [Pseudomonas sp. FW507-12TSA]